MVIMTTRGVYFFRDDGIGKRNTLDPEIRIR